MRRVETGLTGFKEIILLEMVVKLRGVYFFEDFENKWQVRNWTVNTKNTRIRAVFSF